MFYIIQFLNAGCSLKSKSPFRNYRKLAQSSFANMTSSNSSRNLVHINKNPNYNRVTPFLCVISNSQNDFVCHKLFIKAASSYFGDLLTYQKEDYEVAPGEVVPRIFVDFSDNLLEEFFHFAYSDKMNFISKNVEELLKFSSFINSVEMLSKVDDYFCSIVDSLPANYEQHKEYFRIAEDYMLENFKQKLTARVTQISSSA